MKKYLFTYGWLMRAYRKAASANVPDIPFPFVGEAKAPGTLYLVGRYPGFVPNNNAHVSVQGEVFEITDDGVLYDLDVFEQAYPVVNKNPEYIRKEIQVQLVNGETIGCEAYCYARSVEGLIVITSGYFDPEKYLK